ncbi:FtsH protease activity modulator HflK [Nitrospira sp. BLG_1]|uniref:FtsH protease activity modulator HflK n=1 Tax=Nitrospira sp. BLG_1 TaxID=3395883 RepID=UPI0039BC3FFF
MVWDPNDPWSRNKDPLEEALKQVRSKMKELFTAEQFGGWKSGLPTGGLLNVVITALLIFFIWQSVFIVAPDEEGVVKRFGVPVRTVEPGPHFKIPFAETVLQPKVAKLFRVEVGFRTSQQGRQQMVPQEALMLTGDMNILAIEFIVQYKIKEAGEFLFNVADIHETIGKAAEASMREVVGKSKIDEALTTGKAVIQQDTMTLLQTILDQYHSGVQIAAVQLQDVDPPEAVAAAFKDVTNAKEDREKLINQAQGYRNDIIPRAKGEAAELVNRAKGFAQARLNRAQGEANRFLATLKEYNQSKDVISKRIYIETMEEILPNMEKIIIDGKGGERLLPYLPLDRRSKLTAASGAKASSQLESEESRPEPSPTLKSRGARP